MSVQTLVVQDGAGVYRLHTVDPVEAESVGCPGATHKYVGTYATVYGEWRETSGKVVKVRRPKYTAMRGVHGKWFAYGDGFDTITGWAV
jgi:hypothetical protein